MAGDQGVQGAAGELRDVRPYYQAIAHICWTTIDGRPTEDWLQRGVPFAGPHAKALVKAGNAEPAAPSRVR
jgi:hypothetical protein